MSIKHVILGYLTEKPLTGYDLKKKFASSEIFYWSGNSNQIYKALVELHNEKLVDLDVQYQESKPPRKIYHITAAGEAALHQWMQSTPELPQFQNPLLMRLMWADQLDRPALKSMLTAYEEELKAQIVLLRAQMRHHNPQRLTFADHAADHWISFYELELDWVQAFMQELDS